MLVKEIKESISSKKKKTMLCFQWHVSWKILAKPQILSFLLKILLVYRFLNQMGQNVQIKKDGTKHFKFLLTYFFGWACQILLFPIVQ